MAQGDPEFAALTSEVLTFGTLSHSHLNQILKNIRGEAHGRIPSICGSDGRFKMTLLAGRDGAFAEAAQHGLLWEVLSFKIQVEEPEGCSVIQAALNSKNGLYMAAHEMQAVLAVARHATAVAERGLTMQTVRRRVQETMPHYAMDELFPDLFRFVIDLGGLDGPFLDDLRMFHEKQVNPKLRRLKLSSFALVGTLPIKLPFLKVAAIKWMYGHKSEDSKKISCDVLQSKDVKLLISEQDWHSAAVAAEGVLSFFHSDLKLKFRQLPQLTQTIFFGALDRKIFESVLPSKNENVADKQLELRRRASNFYRKAAKDLGDSSLPPPPWIMIAEGARRGGGDHSSGHGGGSVSSPPHPKLIAFDAQVKPTSSQDTWITCIPEERFLWSQFLETEEVGCALCSEQARSVLFAALHSQQNMAMLTEQDLQVVRRADAKAPVVLAARDFEAHALCSVLVASRPGLIMEKSLSPQAITAQVQLDDGILVTLSVCGSVSLPPAVQTEVAAVAAKDAVASNAAVAANGVAHAGRGEEWVSKHEWRKHHSVLPFWCIPRSGAQEKANLVLQVVLSRVVTAHQAIGKAGGDGASVCEVSFPVMTNSAKVATGEELVVFQLCAGAPKQPPENEQLRRLGRTTLARNIIARRSPRHDTPAVADRVGGGSCVCMGVEGGGLARGFGD